MIVPVVVSTALSTKDSVPSLACPPPTGSARTTSFSARRSWISDRFAAGTANRTRIGRIWLMVTRGVASLARTRFPSRTRRLPVRPAIGARMVAYWRLSRASASSAVLAATVAAAAAAAVRDWSYCCAVTYSCPASSL